MRLAFRLREEYEGAVGTIVNPATGGVYDYGAALEEGDGAIITDNVALGNALRTAVGPESTPLFDGFTVPDEEGEDWTPLPSVVRESGSPAPTVETLPSDESVVAAEHGDAEDYERLHKDDLREIVDSRGLEVATSATKAELVEALQTADREG